MDINDKPEPQPEGFTEALNEWKRLQIERGESFKPRNIDELLARNPLAEFKDNE